MDTQLTAPTREQAPPHLEWHWTEALATAAPGSRYRVLSIPFSMARERCRELRCSEGEVLTCVANEGHVLRLACADGRSLFMEREIAWFIRVAPHGPESAEALEPAGRASGAAALPVPAGAQTTPAPPMRKILVAFDGTRTAVHALRHVIELGRQDPALSVHLVIGVKRLVRSGPPTRRVARLLAEGERMLEEAGVPHTTEILEGPVADAIARRADELGCDGIVMGTRGMTALRNLVMASMATRVVHASHVPVTLIKEEGQ